MRVSSHGRAAIAAHEGLRLKAYLCPAGVPTIGVGHTSAAGPPKVALGMTITRSEADEILSRDLKTFEAGVLAALPGVKLGQNEFDALVSLAFNIGTGAFARSSVVRFLKQGNRRAAADAFRLWDKAGGRVLAGLVKRRAEERWLFLADDARTAPLPTPRPTIPAPSRSLWERLMEFLRNLFSRK